MCNAGIFQNALHATLNPSEAEELPAIEPLDLRPPLKKPKRKVTPSGSIVISPEPASRTTPAVAAAGAAGKGTAGSAAAKSSGGERVSQDRIWISAQELQRLQWRLVDGGDMEDEAWELPSLVGLRCARRADGGCRMRSATLK